ncbi:uncharacterized protein LOC143238319 isoform X2 [Tachypleus tridentatus]
MRSLLIQWHLLLFYWLQSNQFRDISATSEGNQQSKYYVVNETACIVDDLVYQKGDTIPTGRECESCKCMPPGFACKWERCQHKLGCRAIRQENDCCPKYHCGCEHNGLFYNDGDRIAIDKSPCYRCYCNGSSIHCSLINCNFRFDCEPKYVDAECCPRYDHCSSVLPTALAMEQDVYPPSHDLNPLEKDSILPVVDENKDKHLSTASDEPVRPEDQEETNLSDHTDEIHIMNPKNEEGYKVIQYEEEKKPHAVVEISNVSMMNRTTESVPFVQHENKEDDFKDGRLDFNSFNDTHNASVIGDNRNNHNQAIPQVYHKNNYSFLLTQTIRSQDTGDTDFTKVSVSGVNGLKGDSFGEGPEDEAQIIFPDNSNDSSANFVDKSTNFRPLYNSTVVSVEVLVTSQPQTLEDIIIQHKKDTLEENKELEESTKLPGHQYVNVYPLSSQEDDATVKPGASGVGHHEIFDDEILKYIYREESNLNVEDGAQNINGAEQSGLTSSSLESRITISSQSSQISSTHTLEPTISEIKEKLLNFNQDNNENDNSDEDYPLDLNEYVTSDVIKVNILQNQTSDDENNELWETVTFESEQENGRNKESTNQDENEESAFSDDSAFSPGNIRGKDNHTENKTIKLKTELKRKLVDVVIGRPRLSSSTC